MATKADIPACTVNCKEFQDFESVMRGLIGWPVPFSWNKRGQVWIAVPGLRKPDRAMLGDSFPALAQIVNFLSVQVEIGALDRTAGFYVKGSGIWRTSSKELIARLQCIQG